MPRRSGTDSVAAQGGASSGSSQESLSSASPGNGGLQPQDLVLTIFGSYVRRPGDIVWSGGMVDLLTEFGFSNAAARAALSRLVIRDLLAREKRGRLAFYSLTERADALLAEGDRRIFSFARTTPALDTWTVLWHAIPEDRRVARSRFASRLRFLGFGSVQDATWVAARDREQEVRALLAELEIEEYASVMVGRMSRGLPPVALVAQAWKLDAVKERYDEFLDEYGPLRRPRARRGLDQQQAFAARTVMLHRFRSFPFLDPELPAAVDPLRASREEVVKIFDDVYAALEEPAAAYFRAVAQPETIASR
jgi:phenylacetic acid degradation operon negative regulatory protein